MITPHATSRRLPRGFTIVELLTVTVMIVVLASLVLPAVLHIRQTALLTQCVNREHEVSVALKSYSIAKGHFPSANWCQAILSDLNRDDVAKAGAGGNNVTITAFVCPSDSDAVNRAAGLSYALNSKLYTDYNSPAKIPALEKTVMFGEKLGSGTWPASATVGCDGGKASCFSSNHDSVVVVTYCDGHTEKLNVNGDL